MFEKIDIKKFGLYNDFVWPNVKDLPAFGRVNIIYGRNYSGKTTLSRIFDSLALGRLHKDYLDGEFTLYTEEAAVPKVTQANMDKCPYPVRVYNSDYVNRNLGWLNDEETGEIKPFALIGSDNLEAQKAIDDIDSQLGNVEEKKGLLYDEEQRKKEYNTQKEAYDTAWNNLETQLKNKANSDIKKKNLFVKQGTTYNVNNIKTDIDEFVTAESINNPETGETTLRYTMADNVVLTDEQKSQLERTVGETEKGTIDKLPETEPHLTEYEKTVCELVAKPITMTKTLEELVANDLLQAWVDQGRALNRDRERCAFCNSPISKERWEALDAHFSKESDELKSSLTEQKAKLEKASEALDNYLADKEFTVENIYTAHKGEFDAVIKKWDGYVGWYKEVLGKLIDLIDERLTNIFKPVSKPHSGLDTKSHRLIPILLEVNALIEKNNAYGAELEKAKQSARKKLRLNYVHGFCLDINYAEVMQQLAVDEVKVAKLKTAWESVTTEVNDLKKLRKQKELDKKDEGKAALKVSTLLVNHFGNGSLTLEPETVEEDVDEETGEVKPRTRFVVKRGGQLAKNLSEGEKSLVSFCYFIAQMDDELKGPDADKLVVYIDDPISSLDSNHIFFMYSLIDTVFIKKTCFGQLFVSTHNLEFLKFTKRFKLSGPKGTKTISKYVVVKLGKKTTDDFRCEIHMMPVYLSKYVTEYNFLFEQIYDIAKLNTEQEQTLYGEQYTQYYNIGNNMRKFLECYLFYRYPDHEEPLTVHLDQLFDDHVPSEVNRVVNEYSHLAWAERGSMVMDVPEVVTAAKEIMKALQTKDNEHFKTLCKTVNRDETVSFA